MSSVPGTSTVWIPVEDGGSMEVPADDPRAIEYLRHWRHVVPAPLPRPRGTRGTYKGVYTVQPGDTLTAIAKDLLGNANLWPSIAQLNRLADPNLILVGQRLMMPGGNSVGGESSSAALSSSPPPGGSIDATTPAPSASVARLALARGFMFIIFEQLPEIGIGSKIIRKVAIVPKNYAYPFPSLGPELGIPMGVGRLSPLDPLGVLSPAEHAIGGDAALSPFLSASERPFGAPSIKGQPLLIDVAKVKAAGGQVLTVDELAADLARYAAENPTRGAQIEQLMWAVKNVEGEVLIRGSVPPGAATPITGAAHLGHIRSAEDLWAEFTAGKIGRGELESGLVDLERAYARARIVGRVGRVFTVVGVILTAYDLEQAAQRSYRQSSVKPIGAEVIRQIGGWGGGIAGAKLGAVVGAAFGIETGPGAIVTGAVGAVIFGALGYFGADLIADEISPN